MANSYPNGDYRLRDLERRLGKIEDTKPEVIADRLNALIEEVKWLKRGVYSLVVMLALAAVTFAFNAAQSSTAQALHWVTWPW